MHTIRIGDRVTASRQVPLRMPGYDEHVMWTPRGTVTDITADYVEVLDDDLPHSLKLDHEIVQKLPAGKGWVRG